MALPPPKKRTVKKRVVKTASSGGKTGANMEAYFKKLANIGKNKKSTTPPPRTKRQPVKSLIKPKVSGIVKNAGISKPKGSIITKVPVKQKPTTATQARKEGRAERKSLRETKRAKRFVQRKSNQASRRTTRTQNAIKRQAKRTTRVKKRTTK